MTCSKCGAVIPDGAQTCDNCGTPAFVEENVIIPVYSEEASKRLSKAGQSKTLGIIGIALSVFLPPAGIIVGAVALDYAKKGLGIEQKTDFKTGKILSYIAIGVGVVMSLIGVVRNFI